KTNFSQFIANGSMTTIGNESIINGSFSFVNNKNIPLVILNGTELTNMISFNAVKGKYRLLVLDEKDGIAKYGDKAQYGALEINRL
ncbi:MAG TPA: hypothetical protein VKI61_05950, partial [Chitinophagaceae bacterium]|nr:hypothetical protein [Chitinophagaceae bacterium]